MLPVPCLHSSHQRQQIVASSERKQAGAAGKGEKNTHHSAHQTPGSAFLNPCLRSSPCPASPTLRLIHPALATLGHESRLCMTARNIPCHKCFPKASTFVTLSADKNLPTTPWRSVPLTFLNVSTISGWLARHGVLAMSAMCVCVCCCVCLFLAYICLNIFMSLCFFSPVFSFYVKREKKGPCHSCTS